MGADCSSWGPNIHGWLSEGECRPSDDILLPLLELGRRDARDDVGLSIRQLYSQPMPCRRTSLVINEPEEPYEQI